jgi:hypothetical protein
MTSQSQHLGSQNNVILLQASEKKTVPEAGRNQVTYSKS